MANQDFDLRYDWFFQRLPDPFSIRLDRVIYYLLMTSIASALIGVQFFWRPTGSPIRLSVIGIVGALSGLAAVAAFFVLWRRALLAHRQSFPDPPGSFTIAQSSIPGDYRWIDTDSDLVVGVVPGGGHYHAYVFETDEMRDDFPAQADCLGTIDVAEDRDAVFEAVYDWMESPDVDALYDA